MTLASIETINCRRFLAAWTRFQTTMEHHHQLDDDVVAQYQKVALHFQQLLQDNDALKDIEPDLASVLGTIAALKKGEKDVAKSRRIPRMSELAKLREEQNCATKRCIKPRTATKEKELYSARGEQMEEVHGTPELRSDLTAEDFKLMLLKADAPHEEKLSTKAMRKRLGLVDRLEVQTSVSETVAREEQESIQSEIMSLAKQLKDRTQTINQSLAEDVKILDAVGQSAESNTVLLDRENAKLKEQLASSIGLWTSLWLVAMLVVVFIVTYFYIKLFSRRW